MSTSTIAVEHFAPVCDQMKSPRYVSIIFQKIRAISEMIYTDGWIYFPQATKYRIKDAGAIEERKEMERTKLR
jgi:hypothetical protein